MKESKTEKGLRRVAFAEGVLSGLTAIRLLYVSSIGPLRYPHSHIDDMNAIGSDMWRAFEGEQVGKKEQEQVR